MQIESAAALDRCFHRAGGYYDISPEILRSIARVESGFNPVAVNRNPNGTYDYGLMQINSSWYRRLGPERWQNLSDPCYSIHVGAWILSQCIGRYGYTWEAVGCYNASSKKKRDAYARKIAKAIKESPSH
jgi:soluble lytic murein transglycosylase-like protein